MHALLNYFGLHTTAQLNDAVEAERRRYGPTGPTRDTVVEETRQPLDFPPWRRIFAPSATNERKFDGLYYASLVNWKLLTRSQRETCIASLRFVAENSEDLVAKWHNQWSRGVIPGSDDLRFHFGVGMTIRNILRETVPDEQLPVSQNWDDFYMGALHEFLSEYHT